VKQYKQSALDQYYTPTWAAELLLRRHFPGLSGSDCVLDPSCGDGRLLMAVPDHVAGIGVEVDPLQAEFARQNTGRDIITGDFLTTELPDRPTVVFGNPPFKAKLFEEFMARIYELLEYEQKAGFILPVYFFQTANTTMRFAEKWSIGQELLPRNLFQNMTKPLCFATFIKDRKTQLSGFFLYSEVAALESMKQEYRERFIGNRSRASVWKETVYAAMRVNGGRASLDQLYRTIENNRPTNNPFWREKIRQVAAQLCDRVAPGVFQLA